MTAEQFIAFIGALVLGLLKVPFVDWLKSKLGFEANLAFALSYAVAFAVAFLALLVSGELAGGLTWGNFFLVANTIIATAQLAYKALNPQPQS